MFWKIEKSRNRLRLHYLKKYSPFLSLERLTLLSHTLPHQDTNSFSNTISVEKSHQRFKQIC
uniref:Uncharacterized protein n=1 Tax=Arundo donax TaxID=35708 RepID=A0A0A9DHR9_ARUDO